VRRSLAPRKFVSAQLIIKGQCLMLMTHIMVNSLKMRGLVYKPNDRHYVVCGWGWEGNTFVVHAEPISWPQAL